MRIEQACKLVSDRKWDALLIEHPSDLFYLTNQWFSAGRLLLRGNGAALFVDGRYFGQAQRKVPCDVILAEKEALKLALKGLKRVAFDSSFVTVDQLKKVQELSPEIEWTPVPRPIKELRVCKDGEELKRLKVAAEMTANGYRHILNKMKEGIEEEELALEFEMDVRRHGASKCSFDPIVAFGENSAFPHYRAGKGRLLKNEMALFDLGAVFEHYRGDMTRVVFYGEPNRTLEQFYGWVRQAHDLAAMAIRPGVRLGELDRIVREFFAKQGVESLFSHSLGHGVGIDVHEYPLLRADGDDRDLPIRAGMVFTIEPGLYLPGVGGVRYENTFVVTESGSENFYDAL